MTFEGKASKILRSILLKSYLTLFFLCYVCRCGNTASVELYDTSSEVADININTMLRSLVIPDEEMVPVLPKVLNVSLALSII